MTRWKSLYLEEVKLISYIAGPMVAVNLSHYFLQVIALMMVGHLHLGDLYLSGTAIAISFCAVTGFSVVFGMASALETICGQAYGAEQYERLGTQMYTCIFCLVLICFPLSLLWLCMGKLLVFLGQDPLISQEAGKFATWLIPALFAYAILQSLVKYFQAQSLVRPLIVTACICICFHVVLCWGLIFKFGLGTIGAALAIGMSYGLNATLLGLYMMCSSSCAETRARISMEIFRGIREFFRIAIPSACMSCLEWWSFEFLTLLSGLLPNPTLEASVLSVCLSTTTTLFTIPEGLAAAASTRVSNNLGAGNPKVARRSFYTVMFLAATQALVVSSLLFASRNVFGYIFSNEKEIVEKVTSMAPLVCLCVVLDSFQAVLSGVARGSGCQDIGAFVNLAAYYLCGIPVAAVLAFWLQLGGRGLWIGILAGAFVQSASLLIITCRQNWEKQVGMFATDTYIVSSILFASRNVLGYIFSNEKEVVDNGMHNFLFKVLEIGTKYFMKEPQLVDYAYVRLSSMRFGSI
ncbi:hypothetical protein ACFE04_017856 [Oxalis oulophora]